jgi:hypothetical protein
MTGRSFRLHRLVCVSTRIPPGRDSNASQILNETALAYFMQRSTVLSIHAISASILAIMSLM